jgi:hypothetical protein
MLLDVWSINFASHCDCSASVSFVVRFGQDLTPVKTEQRTKHNTLRKNDTTTRNYIKIFAYYTHFISSRHTLASSCPYVTMLLLHFTLGRKSVLLPNWDSDMVCACRTSSASTSQAFPPLFKPERQPRHNRCLQQLFHACAPAVPHLIFLHPLSGLIQHGDWYVLAHCRRRGRDV